MFAVASAVRVRRRDAGAAGSDNDVDRCLRARRYSAPLTLPAVGDHGGRRGRDAPLVEPVDDDRAAAVLVDACRRTRRRDDHPPRALVTSRSPNPSLAALFAQHPDVVDARGRVDGLEHVVERQRRHADRRQRLHLHPGAVGAAHRGGDGHLGLADFEVDVDAGQRELMTQRDQVAGAFGRQDARHPGGGQRVALGQSARGDELDDVGARPQRARRDGGAFGGVLTGHVDHVRRARFVQVRKPVLARSSHRYLLTMVTGCVYGISSAGSGNANSPNGDSAPVRSAASSLIG